jgi:ribosomal protein S18 acetylase RimI-like enzyme
MLLVNMQDEVSIRPAVVGDARTIAGFYRICSGGVADYIWSELAEPGEDLIDVGARRYAREGVPFSYENCLLAELEGEIVGMAHAYRIKPSVDDGFGDVDPVLRPYAELELPGSLYISGVAVSDGCRGHGIGSKLIDRERERARELGCDSLSALVFSGNHGSLRLLGRHGFEVVDRRPVVPHELLEYTGEVLLLSAPV